MLKTVYRAVRSVTPPSGQRLIGKAYNALLQRLPLKAKISVLYFKSFGRFPDFANPKTFNEKCQALKVSGKNLSRYVDKVLVKDYVQSIIGEKYVIPTLYHGPNLPPRNERGWPLPYVIKTNNGSSTTIFVRENPDWGALEKIVDAYLAWDYSRVSGEMFYVDVIPQVLVEPFIGANNVLPLDYKFFMFGGKMEFLQVDTDREKAHKRVFFDAEWNKLPMSFGYPFDERHIEKPANLDEMIRIASALSAGLPFVRVDLYNIDGRILFGEMTFTPDSGFRKFEPMELDNRLGAKWA